MRIKKLSVLALSACLLASALASTASAASKWCVTTPTGQVICFPVLIEDIRIKLPPDPGPYLPVDVSELTRGLSEILGADRQTWILRDALGERAIMVDFETGQAVEIPQLQAGF